jgi:hypothetical protein
MCAGGTAGAGGGAGFLGAELLEHFFGVVICDVVGGDWVGHGVQLWASAVVVGPVSSFGAYGWSPERQGGCGLRIRSFC